jgi:hypothetical protein
VMDAGVGERRLHMVAIDGQRVAGVLLDDGEQVTQQPLLERRELGVVDGGLVVRIVEAVHARAIGGQDGGKPIPVALVAARLAAAARVTAADGPAQAPAR